MQAPAAVGYGRRPVEPITVTNVRIYTYRRFLEDGLPPSVSVVAEGLGISKEDAEDAFLELQTGRVLVFEPGTLDVWMANPLCARPTGFRVTTESGSWWGTCVWDSFGIGAMLDEDTTIATSDPATGEPFELRVEGGALVATHAVAHFSLPARRWWDDIGYS